jgi:hypothetical protein
VLGQVGEALVGDLGRAPSKANGLVTMATVRAPQARARVASSGAAAVPVPPPRPAAMRRTSSLQR